MNAWLTLLGNLTMAASLAMLLVLVVRTVCGRLPKRYLTFLWLPVFIRAVCPVSFHSAFSLYGLLDGLPGFHAEGGRMTFTLAGYQSARLAAVLQHAGLGGIASEGGEAGIGTVAAGSGVSGIVPLLFSLWLAGVLALLAFGFLSWLSLRRKTALAVWTEEDVYESDRIGSAFLLGFFRPRIYLPIGLSGEERILVLEHERNHKRRQDSRVKLVTWCVCVMHWFNPLLWLAFALLARDMEMACDEQVLERLGVGEKKNYSTFLLKLSAPGGFLTGTPVAFGENSIKACIKNILRYRVKTKAEIIGAAVALVIGVFWSCLSNPSRTDIIGGADGPTSIFLAGTLGSGESGSDEVSILSGENLSLNGEVKQAFQVIETFAKASADRDADTVWELLSPTLQRRDDLGIQILEDGTKTMGVSSPFTADSPRISVSFGDGTAKAEITYPSMTSDPLWWSRKDYITLKKNGDIYQVTEWQVRYFDVITSSEEFEEAYRMWQPDYLNASGEMGESFASYLVRNDSAGSYASYYGEAFSTPVKALETTLHVSGGVGTTESAEGSDVWVNYQFKDGTVRVRMTQPGLTEGSRIWVPKEIEFP